MCNIERLTDAAPLQQSAHERAPLVHGEPEPGDRRLLPRRQLVEQQPPPDLDLSKCSLSLSLSLSLALKLSQPLALVFLHIFVDPSYTTLAHSKAEPTTRCRGDRARGHNARLPSPGYSSHMSRRCVCAGESLGIARSPVADVDGPAQLVLGVARERRDRKVCRVLTPKTRGDLAHYYLGWASERDQVYLSVWPHAALIGPGFSETKFEMD